MLFHDFLQKVAERRGYQRWAMYQLNRLALPSGELPFRDRPDSDIFSFDVLVLNSNDDSLVAHR